MNKPKKSENEPTAEEIKEFWERCGFRVAHIKDSFAVDEHWAIQNSYDEVVWDGYKLEDSIDLNNLFNFAVPKLDGYIMFTSEGGVKFIASYNCMNYEATNQDPALAVFRALDQVRQKEKDETKKTE